MADWQFTLDLKDIWKECENDNSLVKVTAIKVAERVQTLAPSLPEPYKTMAETIAVRLKRVNTIAGFDRVMDAIYDLGDTPLPTSPGNMQRKLIWIATVF